MADSANNTTTKSSSALKNKDMIVKKSDYSTTLYLAIFLIVDLIIVGILLCFCSHREWWNNWMVTAPNLFMILGALFCQMMKKDQGQMINNNKNGKMTWLLVYKGIKIALTIVMVVLYLLIVKENTRAFVLITAICYLIALFIETYSILDYSKRLNKKQ